MQDLNRRKPRRWQKRLKYLASVLKKIRDAADLSKPVKGWKGLKKRSERYRKIRMLLRTHTLASAGKRMGGLSRQRVHQLATNQPG